MDLPGGQCPKSKWSELLIVTFVTSQAVQDPEIIKKNIKKKLILELSASG
jgi:hypothetical protein